MDTQSETVICDRRKVTVVRVIKEVHDVCECGLDLCCSSIEHICERVPRKEVLILQAV